MQLNIHVTYIFKFKLIKNKTNFSKIILNSVIPKGLSVVHSSEHEVQRHLCYLVVRTSLLEAGCTA